MPSHIIPADIARAISDYGAMERAFARNCALDKPADAEIDAVIEAALALDAIIACHIAKTEETSPLVAASFPLHPQWRDYLPS